MAKVKIPVITKWDMVDIKNNWQGGYSQAFISVGSTSTGKKGWLYFAILGKHSWILVSMWESWNQSPVDTKGQLYMILLSLMVQM